MRTPVLAANWKMHKTVAEATAFTTAFLPKVADVTDAVRRAFAARGFADPHVFSVTAASGAGRDA